MAAIFSKDDGRAALLELKRAAACLASGVHVRPTNTPATWQHPTRAAEVWWQGRQIGVLSELHPSLVDGGRAAILDLDLTLLQQLAPDTVRYQAIRRFPTSAFDLSIVTGERTLAGTLELQIRQYAGELAEAVEYVREYAGERLPAGQKSVSFRVVAGAPDRTLSSDEIAALRKQVIDGMTNAGYELRV